MLGFLLLLMVTACTACTTNVPPVCLNGQFLAFPSSATTNYARVFSSVQTFNAATVCLRVKTNLCRKHTLFSAATATEDNAFWILRDPGDDAIDVYIQGCKVEFKGLKYDLNKLHSICVTWDSKKEVVQVWIDGFYSIPRHVDKGPITDPVFVLGQDQDSVVGGFSEQQSFVGEIYDLHVWDYVIDSCEIQRYMDNRCFSPGNAINWGDVRFQTFGRVFTESQQICRDDSDTRFTLASDFGVLGRGNKGPYSVYGGQYGPNGCPYGRYGYNGYNGCNGLYGYNGYNGYNGCNGLNGLYGYNGYNGYNGCPYGLNGYPYGFNGCPYGLYGGLNGANGVNGYHYGPNGVPYQSAPVPTTPRAAW